MLLHITSSRFGKSASKIDAKQIRWIIIFDTSNMKMPTQSPIHDLWRVHPRVAAIAAGVLILWLLLAPGFGAPVVVQGLILASAVASWALLADL